MQIEQKLPDDMQAKWAVLSAKFAAHNAARPQLMQMRCATCAPSRTLNGCGDEVQAHFGPRFGWLGVSHPYPCRCGADIALISVAAEIAGTDIDAELQVYEALVTA